MRHSMIIPIAFSAAAALAAPAAGTRAFDAGNTTYILSVPDEGGESALFGGDYVCQADGTVVTNNPHAPVRPRVSVPFSDGKTAGVRLPEEGELASARRHHGGKWEEVWIDSTGAVVSNAVIDARKYKGVTGEPRALAKSGKRAKAAARPKPQKVLHFEEPEAEPDQDAAAADFKPAQPDPPGFVPMHQRHARRARRSFRRRRGGVND